MQGKKQARKRNLYFLSIPIESVRKCKFCGNLSTPKTGEFSTMQEDLDKERKTIMKQWAKRKEQIERVMGAIARMLWRFTGDCGEIVAED
ncbi:MAG: hypothetical protein U1D41_10390 [Nitrosomonas sp.]|nr:hypothetical protein [Nitrosomonas sp.]